MRPIRLALACLPLLLLGGCFVGIAGPVEGCLCSATFASSEADALAAVDAPPAAASTGREMTEPAPGSQRAEAAR